MTTGWLLMPTQILRLEEFLNADFVTYQQVGTLLGMSAASVRLLHLRGKVLARRGNPNHLPVFPRACRIGGLGGEVVFRRSEVEAFMAARAKLSELLLQRLPDLRA